MSQFLGAFVLAGEQGQFGIAVDDRDGRPLEGARLAAEHCPGTKGPAIVETGADGIFQLPAHAGASCTYRITRDGYVPMAISVQTGDSEPIRAALAPLGWISGTVKDSHGEPVQGAVVTAFRWRDGTVAFRPNQPVPSGYQTSSDAHGRFRLHSLLPGEYALGVFVAANSAIFGPYFTLYPENRQPEGIAVHPGGGQPDVAIVLRAEPPTRSVSGNIAFPSGTPLPTSVFVTMRDQPGHVLSTTQAELDGRFWFDRLHPGDYDIYAIAPSAAFGEFTSSLVKRERYYGRVRVAVSTADEESFTLALKPSKAVAIALRCSEQSGCGKCPASATVTVSSLAPWGHSRSTSAAELSFRDGQKSIPGITPGPIQVLASGLGASCFQVRTQPENLEDASPHKPLNVVLTAAAELQIAVKSEPAPPPARVEVLVLAPKAEFDENAVTLAAGAGDRLFSFHDLRPGTYRVLARPASTTSSQGWSREAGHWSQVTLKAGLNSIELHLPLTTQR